ncbi:MAG: toxin-antitoxin system HicB family antitoxin [Candidatus Bipolaricaulia bacterium]
MSTLSVRLPNSLHKQLRELAKSEGISINQLIASAVAEKMAALMTADYLEERAQRGSREKFERVLAKVPDVEPEDFDRMPNKSLQRTPPQPENPLRID